MGLAVVGLELDGLAEGGLGGRSKRLLRECESELVLRRGILGVELRGATQCVEGLFDPVLPVAEQPEERERVRIIGRERAADGGLGFGELILFQLRGGDVAEGDELLVVERERLRELGLGLGEAPLVEVRRGFDEQRTCGCRNPAGGWRLRG